MKKILLCGLLFLVACGGGGGEEVSTPDDSIDPEISQANYNGNYLTSDQINTCKNFLDFRDQIEIRNKSIVGFTLIDQDGSYNAVIYDSKNESYKLNIFEDVPCLARFITDDAFNYLRIVCTNGDFGCEIIYGKPLAKTP